MKTQEIVSTFPRIISRSLLFLALLCLLFAARLAGAQYRAGLQGTVTDTTGAVVPGATVTIVDKETNQTLEVKTDGAGNYTFNRLAPAAYQVSAEGPGFAKKTIDNVNIAGETMQGLNIALEAQGATQTVTVTDTTPAINTSTATIAGTISAKELQSFPSSNRDPYQLLRLSPGALGDGSQSGSGGSYSLPGNGGIGGSSATGSVFQVENRAQTQANGVRTSGNSFQIDGSQVNSLAWGGGAVITPNQESVKEVQTQTSPYDATYGRNSGAQVLVVSKNGTNQFHGSAFFKFHRPGLNAYQRYNGPGSRNNLDNTKSLQRDNNRFNQIGGSVGGPAWKDHLFFFFSYEELRNSGRSQATGWYETPAYDQLIAQTAGGVSAAIAGYKGESVAYTGIDATSTCAFAGLSTAYCHTVSYNGGTALDLGSPLKTALGNPDPTYVSNNAPGIGAGFDGVPDLFRVNVVNPTTNTAQQFNGRLDWQLNPRDLIAYTIYWVPTETTSFNGPNRTANLWHSNRLAYSHAALWNHIFTPSLLNEFRLNGVRWYFNEVATNPQEPFGLPQGRLDTMGGIASSDFQYFGSPGPGNFAQTTYNIRDTLTKTIGSHNIRFGFDGYRELDNDTQTYAAIPAYTFRNLWEFANDKPRLENGAFDPRSGAPTSATKYIRSYIYAGYVQDDWRINPNLTLNIGLRYEYFTPIREKNGNISNVVLGAGPQTLTGAFIKTGGDLFKTSTNNWGPQFGFAYSINPNSPHLTVVRGGFGIAYNRMQEAITLNGRSNPPLVTNLSASCTNTTLSNCPGVFYAAASSPTNINGYPVNPAAKVTFGSNGLPPAGAAQIGLQAIQQNLSTPLTYKTSLGVEHALSQRWIVSVGYQGSLSRHYTRQNNLNWIYYPNLNPSVNAFNYYSNDVTASSHALLTEVRHVFGRGFAFTGQYRFGKILDSGSQDYYIDQYPYDNRFAYGLADYNVAHNAKFFGTWSPTIFPHNKLMDGIFGGIQFSGIIQYHSGFPWTPIYSNTSCNVVYVGSGYCNLRPGAQIAHGTGDTSNDTFKRQGGQFPNGGLAYFTVPKYPATGAPPPPGVGRNGLTGPHYFDTDMDVQKTFGLPNSRIFGENTGLTVRAMFFNLFNQTNLTPFNTGDGNTQITSTTFGQSSSALGARTVELQGRFSF